MLKKIKGGVTAPLGFAAMGLRVGIKEGNPMKKDMAMIYSATPCVAAGTFTTNQVKAAPVKWDRDIFIVHLLYMQLYVTVVLPMPVQENRV